MSYLEPFSALAGDVLLAQVIERFVPLQHWFRLIHLFNCKAQGSELERHPEVPIY